MEARHETLIEKIMKLKNKQTKNYIFHIFLNLITELSVNKTKKESTSKLHD